MPDNFVPPENQTAPQGDLLEQLLVVAAEKAAKQEADEALKKGFVTREQINGALTAFGAQLKSDITDEITAQLLPQIQQTVQKSISDSGMARKGTMTPEDERDADPIAYILKKGKEFGPDSFDDAEKRIIWAVTHKALTEGMDERD